MTLTNYQTLIDRVGISKLDAANKEAYDLVKDASDNFNDPAQWAEMIVDADIREMYEMHVKAIEKMDTPTVKATTEKKAPETRKEKAPKRVKAKPVKKEVVATKPKPVKKAKVKKVKAKAKAKAKKIATTVLKEIPKFPVTVKKFSKELQLIKRFLNMDGNTKSIKSLELFKGDLTKILRTSPDRKSVLSQMLTRLAGAIKKSKEEKATDLKITLDEAFAKTLSSNVKSAKPKLKVEFLGCPPKKKA